MSRPDMDRIEMIHLSVDAAQVSIGLLSEQVHDEPADVLGYIVRELSTETFEHGMAVSPQEVRRLQLVVARATFSLRWFVAKIGAIPVSVRESLERVAANLDGAADGSDLHDCADAGRAALADIATACTAMDEAGRSGGWPEAIDIASGAIRRARERLTAVA